MRLRVAITVNCMSSGRLRDTFLSTDQREPHAAQQVNRDEV